MSNQRKKQRSTAKQNVWVEEVEKVYMWGYTDHARGEGMDYAAERGRRQGTDKGADQGSGVEGRGTGGV